MTISTWEKLFSATHFGLPRPQGSLRAMISKSTGKAMVSYSDSTVAHRNDLINTLRVSWGGREPFEGAVAVDLLFEFERPKVHYRTGKFENELKDSAPEEHTKPADLDKLVRLVGDALAIAGVLKDDAQITKLRARKSWVVQRGSTKITIFVIPPIEGEQDARE